MTETTCFRYAEEINLIIHVRRDGRSRFMTKNQKCSEKEGSLRFGELFLTEEQQESSTVDKC